MQQSLPQEYYQLLEELQAVDFVLVELTLYLDTHPGDVNAINQFNQYAQYRNQIKTAFESKYGPLQQYGNSYSDEKWSWHSGPWPWQV
jgi:spore coat protein JB